MLRFHAQTSGASLTAQQPLNNIVRGTVEALVAVLGGAQSLHISCFDETYGLPTEESAKVSVNTQNILAYETGVAGSVDPLGGSYLVESLTDRLEHEAWSLLEEIRRRGGMVAAARSGWVREQKLAWARRYQEDVDSGRRVVVGVNAFQSEESGDIAYTRPDPEAQEQQIKRTRAVKASRDVERAAKALDALRKAAARGGNVMPYTIDAARNLVTLGEMYETMRSVYGEIPGEEFRYA
jgi:methylmalonyl-CoA mutase N-terminal domain/subunit